MAGAMRRLLVDTATVSVAFAVTTAPAAVKEAYSCASVKVPRVVVTDIASTAVLTLPSSVRRLVTSGASPAPGFALTVGAFSAFIVAMFSLLNAGGPLT